MWGRAGTLLIEKFGGVLVDKFLVHLSSDLFLLVVYGYYFCTFSVVLGCVLLLLDNVCVCDFLGWVGGGYILAQQFC